MKLRKTGTRFGLLIALNLFIAACTHQESTRQTEPSASDVSESLTIEHIQRAAAHVNEANIIEAQQDNWLSTGRTYDEQRHSPLNKINGETIEDLGLDWYWDTGTKRGLEATPIAIDGVMFTTGTWSVVWAHDARTGELLWEFDPDVPRAWGQFACCDVVNRGVAAWNGKIFVGTLDGRLIALDAGTGKPVWEISTVEPGKPYTITGAARVLKDKVIIGNGGADYGTRGYVTAYDTETGRQVWRFHTVPGNPADGFETEAMKLAAQTWHGAAWWEFGGGGTVWDSMAYDPELNLLYVGTGNGAPWDRTIRSPGGGDNLFLASIIALNPDTGQRVWHYQTTPGENWDFTATQQMRPHPLGGHNWQPMTYHPETGLVYIPAMNMPFDYGVNSSESVGDSSQTAIGDQIRDRILSRQGFLSAWDPATQREVWRVQHATSWNGGLLSTAGDLVFQGLADGRFAAYNAEDGALLWEKQVHSGIIAAPVTYAIDGEQHVTVMAGWGGGYAVSGQGLRHRNNVLNSGRILTFKLGGDEELPPPDVTYLAIPTPRPMDYTEEQASRGRDLYDLNCAVCHGPGISTSGPIPNLMYANETTHDIWDGIVLGGAYLNKGMPRFSERLTIEDSQAIRAYVVARANSMIELCESEYRAKFPDAMDTACEIPRIRD